MKPHCFGVATQLLDESGARVIKRLHESENSLAVRRVNPDE